MNTKNWFEVDKKGLAKLREGASRAAIVLELIQNVWDTDATYCKVTLRLQQGTRWELIVEDDNAEGFKDFTHAYTLFAESEKKSDSQKRGRFNLGEKLVLAMCSFAQITSTTFCVVFDENGRHTRRSRTDRGSRFEGVVRLTSAEVVEITETVMSLFPPETCRTLFNDLPVKPRTPLKSFEAVLPTVSGDELRPSRRKCWVEVHETRAFETAMIYEMGIPIVATGDKYHYNVLQKVPLTLDRANVTPSFLRDVREEVAEAMREYLTADDANQTWVREAVSSPEASRELVKGVFEKRFGKDAVIYDPSDPEANQRAMLDGKTVVMGGHMSREEWANVREHTVARPAGQVYTGHKIELSPDGREWTQTSETTQGMRRVKAFVIGFAHYVLNISVVVEFVSEPLMGMGACYSNQVLRFNVGRLGYKAFEDGLTVELLDLIIHELAHERALNHLSDEYHRACTAIGAAGMMLAVQDPALFGMAGMAV